MLRQLSALDCQFLALESDRLYGHVGSVAILDPSTAAGGTVTIERAREVIAERLHLLPPFTSRLEKVPLNVDWPYWVPDEHFDIGYHVRDIALPAPGSMEQLREQVARIYSRRLDRARPLWEVYLIHGLAEGRVALLTKMHHAAIDGMSAAEVMTVLYDLTAEGEAVQAAGELQEPTAKPSGGDLVRRTLTNAPRGTVSAAKRLGRLVPHVDVVPSVFGLPGAERISRSLGWARGAVGDGSSSPTRPRIQPPRGAYDGKVSPHRVFGLGSLSLEDVKRVKDHFGVKVNDVVCSVVAGGLREDMEQAGTLPDGPLVAMVPVSVRTDDERGTFGNQISVMFVPIATHRDDPVARLTETAAELLSAKARHQTLPAKALSDLTQFIPPALHTRAARTVLEATPRLGLQPPWNVVISNVPGPPIDIYTAGARLEAIFPLSIIADGAGLNITIMSYRDSVDIGITADRGQTPHVQDLVDAMARELARLVAIVDEAAVAA